MKPAYHRHGCPMCGHRMSWARLYLRNWTLAQWPCESCGTLLQFHFASRLLCALLLGVWIFFWSIFVLPHVALWVSIVVCSISYISIVQIDRVSMTELKHRD
jgi:hypothetical protein